MPLTISVPKSQLWDPNKNEFLYTKPCELRLEHSLVSIHKWEQLTNKPYFSDREEDKKTVEDIRLYIQCMTLTQNVDPMVYYALTPQNIEDINTYMSQKMTATWFPKDEQAPRSQQVLTSEIIYAQMCELNIPPEYQKWHIASLLTLIRVCWNRQQPKKKRSKADTLNRYRAANHKRRAQRAARRKGK